MVHAQFNAFIIFQQWFPGLKLGISRWIQRILCVSSSYGCRSSTLHFRAEINAFYVYYSSNGSWASTLDFYVEHSAFSVYFQAMVTVL